VFFGTFNHAIDAKGRTSLPVRFRDALSAAGEPRIVLMQYPHWRAVQALPQSVWNELVKKVMDASPLDAKTQRSVLKFVSSAHEVDLDANGRVLVVAPGRDQNLEMSARNLPTVDVILADSLNVVDLIKADTVVIEQPALARMEEVYL